MPGAETPSRKRPRQGDSPRSRNPSPEKKQRQDGSPTHDAGRHGRILGRSAMILIRHPHPAPEWREKDMDRELSNYKLQDHDIPVNALYKNQFDADRLWRDLYLAFTRDFELKLVPPLQYACDVYPASSSPGRRPELSEQTLGDGSDYEHWPCSISSADDLRMVLHNMSVDGVTGESQTQPWLEFKLVVHGGVHPDTKRVGVPNRVVEAQRRERARTRNVSGNILVQWHTYRSSSGSQTVVPVPAAEEEEGPLQQEVQAPLEQHVEYAEDEEGLMSALTTSVRPDSRRSGMGKMSEVRKFFGRHDFIREDDKDQDEDGPGIRLVGTTQPLDDYQQWAIANHLWMMYVGEEMGQPGATSHYPYNGHINAFDVGLGKTRISLGMAQVLNLIQQNKVSVAKSRAVPQKVPLHNPADVAEGVPCPSGNPFGIECPCVAGSLSKVIANAMGNLPGPVLFSMEPSRVVQGLEEARAYFSSHACGHENTRTGAQFIIRPMEVYLHYPSAKMPNTDLAKQPNVFNKIVVPKEGVEGLPTEIPYVNTNATGAKKLPQGPNIDGTGFYDLGNYTLSYRPDATGHESNDIKSQLVIVSGSGTSIDNNGNKVFVSKHEIKVQKRKVRKDTVTVPWAVNWRLIIVDEYHNARTYKTLNMRFLRRSLAHSPGQQTKVLLLSATPFSTDLKSSLEGPLSVLCPSAWDQAYPQGPMYKRSSHYACNKLIPYFADLITKDAKRSSSHEARATHGRYLKHMQELCNSIMLRMEGGDKFLGKALFDLPPLTIHKVSCKATLPDPGLLKRFLQPYREAYRAAAHKAARHAKTDKEKARARDNAKRKTRGWTIEAFTATIPALMYVANAGDVVDGYLMANTIGKIATAEERARSAVADNINLLMAGCAKIQALRNILNQALNDVSPPDIPITDPKTKKGPFRKHVVVFCSRPGMVSLLANFCDKTLANSFNICVIYAGMDATDRAKAIRNTVRPLEVPKTKGAFTGTDEKPALVIAAVQTAGTGIHGLQIANYAVFWDIPYSEALVKQAFGRIKRRGQIHNCHGFMLESTTTRLEPAIYKRHEKREKIFGGFQTKDDEQGGGGAGGGDKRRYGGVWDDIKDGWQDKATKDFDDRKIVQDLKRFAVESLDKYKDHTYTIEPGGLTTGPPHPYVPYVASPVEGADDEGIFDEFDDNEGGDDQEQDQYAEEEEELEDYGCEAKHGYERDDGYQTGDI